MSTPEALGLACLLGAALSLFSPWVITLILSVLLFAVALGTQLFHGERLAPALLSASVLLAALQVSYVVAGQIISVARPAQDYVEASRDEHNRG